MTPSFYNTMAREKKEFYPINPPIVTMYSCGPTVYSRAHIGNMRAYIFSDTVRRTLEYFGFQVNHAMNVTDVGHLTGDNDDGQDKMEVGSTREGLSAWDIAHKYEDLFFTDCAKLNIKRPNTVCRATEHINEQIDLIRSLVQRGYAYATSDGLYFDSSKYPEYWQLAKLDIEGMEEGKRVDKAEKRSKTDFSLWKFSPSGAKRQMEWDSPWGKGFPGWHIECSAMAMKYLGIPIDIHTGGVDHIAVHHTNEIAQSECGTGIVPFVRYWLHCEFLIFSTGNRMGKSTGNALSIDSLLERGVPPLAFRYLCLGTHYRVNLNYSEMAIDSATTAFNSLKERVFNLKKLTVEAKPRTEQTPLAKSILKEFSASVADDCNMPQCLGILWTMLKNTVLTPDQKLILIEHFDAVLGLNLLSFEDREASAIPSRIQHLLDLRQQARDRKDWAESDRLRQEIERNGILVIDTKTGQEVKGRIE